LLEKMFRKKKTENANVEFAVCPGFDKYVGKVIEVQYISCNIPKIEKGVLKFLPNNESFYVGKEDSYHILYWNKRYRIGEKEITDAVALIKDENGNELYRNDKVIELFETLKTKKN